MEPTQQSWADKVADYLADNTMCERCWLYSSCWHDCRAIEKERKTCVARMSCWLRHIASPVLSDKEQEFCEWAGLFEYEWLARDLDGGLRCFWCQPEKDEKEWVADYCYPASIKIPGEYEFNFIGWEDTYPTYIPDLIMIRTEQPGGAENE